MENTLIKNQQLQPKEPTKFINNNLSINQTENLARKDNLISKDLIKSENKTTNTLNENQQKLSLSDNEKEKLINQYNIKKEDLEKTWINVGEAVQTIEDFTKALEIQQFSQKSKEPISHCKMLKELLDKVEYIGVEGFSELAGISPDKLRNNHYAIITIEEILKLAKQNSYGMCRNYDFFYLFNGAYWDYIEKDIFRIFLGEAAEKMGVDPFKAKEKNFRRYLLEQFIELAYLPKPEPTKDVIFINLKNGTLVFTSTGHKLQSFDRENFLTYQLSFNYNSDTTAPIFKNYLNKVLPNIDKQKILAEYLGYVFISPSVLKLEKALILYGKGANGKSVFYEVVRHLFGEQNTSEFSLQSITNENGYFRAKIANKLVNYSSEISVKLGTPYFKQIVSGEPVEARQPYGQAFILKDYAKLIFNCNELPKDVEQTEAFFRRFLIITFDITIPEAEQDKQLAQKIISTELSGVLNWVLEGLYRLLQQKHFTHCKAVEEAREQYKLKSDSVKLFLQETGYKSIPDSKLWTQTKLLYEEYRKFCWENGYKPTSKGTFEERLEAFDVIIEEKNVGKVAYVYKSNISA